MRSSIVAALISIILLIVAAPTLAEVYPECETVGTPVVSGTTITVTQSPSIDYGSYNSVWSIQQEDATDPTGWGPNIYSSMFKPDGTKLQPGDVANKDTLSFKAPVVDLSKRYKITFGVQSIDPLLVTSCAAWKCYVITVNPPDCANLIVNGCKYCIIDSPGTGTYEATGTIANNPALTYVWQIRTAATDPTGVPPGTWSDWSTLTDESGKVSGATTSTLVINWNSCFPTNVNKMFYQIQLIVSNKAGGQSWSKTITNCPCADLGVARSYISVYKRPTITTSITPST